MRRLPRNSETPDRPKIQRCQDWILAQAFGDALPIHFIEKILLDEDNGANVTATPKYLLNFTICSTGKLLKFYEDREYAEFLKIAYDSSQMLAHVNLTLSDYDFHVNNLEPLKKDSHLRSLTLRNEIRGTSGLLNAVHIPSVFSCIQELNIDFFEITNITDLAAIFTELPLAKFVYQRASVTFGCADKAALSKIRHCTTLKMLRLPIGMVQELISDIAMLRKLKTLTIYVGKDKYEHNAWCNADFSNWPPFYGLHLACCVNREILRPFVAQVGNLIKLSWRTRKEYLSKIAASVDMEATIKEFILLTKKIASLHFQDTNMASQEFLNLFEKKAAKSLPSDFYESYETELPSLQLSLAKTTHGLREYRKNPLAFRETCFKNGLLHSKFFGQWEHQIPYIEIVFSTDTEPPLYLR